MSRGARTAALAAALATSLAFGAAGAFDDEDELEDAGAAPEQAEPQAAQKEEEKPRKRPGWLEKLDRFADYLHERGILVPADGRPPKSRIPYFVIPDRCITPERRIRIDTEECRLWNEALIQGCRTDEFEYRTRTTIYTEREGFYWDTTAPRCGELYRRIRALEAERAARPPSTRKEDTR